MSTYSHTPYIQERRRALFPAQDESDSDLGPMSPLSSDINDSDTESISDEYYFKSLRANSSSDYVILGNVKTALDTSATSDDDNEMQPLHLSPFSQLLTSPIVAGDQTIVPDTPVKGSPTQSLKTPHDTAITQTSLPKLIRKSVLETVMSKEGNKRLSSPIDSPESKRLKVDGKGSKVRTALFPEPEAVPTKSFYSKTETNKVELKRFDYDLQDDRPKRKKQTMYLCNRRTRGKNRFGQINAGVRHKIKKPKHKKPTKTSLLRAALRIIEDSPLSEYLKDINDLQTKQITPVVQQCVKKPSEPESRKREPSPEPDPNRKFFKSSRHRGIVTVNGNIRLEVDGKNVTLLQKNDVKKAKTDICFDDADFNEDNVIDKSLISNVLDMLEEEKENVPTPTKAIVLKAHTSVKASENSILLHNTSQKRAHSEILSPISQMCDTTSGLALNSPKKARNLNAVLENMCAYSSTDSANVFSKFSSLPNMEEKKMFPIFEKNYRPPKSVEKSDKHAVSQGKKWKALPADQMLLDAGQKRFGPTQCVECGIIYHMGDPSEELMHLKYHGYANVLKFHGWKNEDVVVNCLDGRIIRIRPSDPKPWWKKVKEVLQVVNHDLGYCETPLETETSQVYLYIKNKSIVGCLLAEIKTVAHRRLNLDGVDACSEAAYPTKCGVSRIWVSPSHRRQGVATSLMDALRGNFLLGCFLQLGDIAFSTPTEMGGLFARKYFKADDYLIYL